MNLNDAPPGHAFDGDYPESYGDLAQQYFGSLQRQIEELERTCSGSGATSALTLLARRRSGRTNLPQLDIVLRADGTTSQLSRGDLLMDARSAQIKAVADLLLSRGFTAHRHEHSEFVRWRPAALDDIAKVVDECRALGVETWPNYLVPMAAIGKGIGGPEPVAGFVRFTDYRIPSAPDYGSEPGTRVAVIDTGIPSLQAEGGYPGMSRSDEWLANVARHPDNRDLLDDLPNGPDGYLDFQAGHGTFVAGIIQRVAPNADIRVYRAADSDGLATDEDIAGAMLRAVADGAQIVNLSLAGQSVDNQPPPATAAAVQRIQQESNGQVVIVAAAGNYGDSVPCWPAALEGVEAVAAVTADLVPTRWSSRGGHIRFSAVAEGIRSTFVTGLESSAFDPDPDQFGENAWALWSGTSFSTPQIAGAVARICYELRLTPRRAVDRLHERALPTDGCGRAMQILEGIR